MLIFSGDPHSSRQELAVKSGTIIGPGIPGKRICSVSDKKDIVLAAKCNNNSCSTNSDNTNGINDEENDNDNCNDNTDNINLQNDNCNNNDENNSQTRQNFQF